MRYQLVVTHFIDPFFMGNMNYFKTYYNAHAEAPWTAQEFDTQLTSIIAAERFMSPQHVLFPRATALEVEEDRRYHAYSTAWPVVPRGVDITGFDEAPHGMRTGQFYDQHAGITVLMPTLLGRARRFYLPACIQYEDVGMGYRALKRNKNYTLNQHGPMARRCFPVYKSVLDDLDALYTEFQVNHLGETRETEVNAGYRILGYITNNVHQRQAWRWATQYRTYVNRKLGLAGDIVARFLGLYYDRMQAFNHRWGDHEAPFIEDVVYYCTYASWVWLDLAALLNFQVPGNLPEPLVFYDNPQWIGARPAPGGLVALNRETQVFDLVNGLFRSWSYLASLYERGLFKYSNAYANRWSQEHPSELFIYASQRLYEDYDVLMWHLFKVYTLIALLEQCLIVKNPRHKALSVANYGTSPRFRKNLGAGQEPATVEWQPYQVIYPLPKDPYLTTPPATPPPPPPDPTDPAQAAYVLPPPPPTVFGDETVQQGQFYEALKQAKRDMRDRSRALFPNLLGLRPPLPEHELDIHGEWI